MSPVTRELTSGEYSALDFLAGTPAERLNDPRLRALLDELGPYARQVARSVIECIRSGGSSAKCRRMLEENGLPIVGS